MPRNAICKYRNMCQTLTNSNRSIFLVPQKKKKLREILGSDTLKARKIIQIL